IQKNILNLQEYNVDCVGGIMITLPANKTLLAQSIALALSHPFGVGNSYFRIGSKEPRLVDTVPFGCYRREVFKKIGRFDEELVRNQDDEFNFRLIKNGGKILLVPKIVSYYYARGKLSQLFRQYFQYGYFKVRVAQKIGAILTWRQLIPAIFVGSLIFTGVVSFFSKLFLWLFLLVAISYFFANFGFSLSIAVKRGIRFFPSLVVAFATLHFSYGFGYLKGIWDFMICKKHLKKKIKDVPLTR
ncbi:glycosyltransferase family 2 protein, partial [Candidatus Aerophobetes bacterium]|nr:glycosyltransferase family 2 protein [Candidatus Aerophobetes bacterium]